MSLSFKLIVIIFPIVIFCLLLVIILLQLKIFHVTKFTKKRNKLNVTNQDAIIDFFNNLSSVLVYLSTKQIGALIIIENHDNLQMYIDSGRKVNVPFFPEFIVNIFDNHNSPLHDGAIIIRNFTIVSLSSYLPTTNRELPVGYGSRHRASFGISEQYDCYSFIVSETTGSISCMHNGIQTKLSNKSDQIKNQIYLLLRDNSIFSNVLMKKQF